MHHTDVAIAHAHAAPPAAEGDAIAAGTGSKLFAVGAVLETLTSWGLPNCDHDSCAVQDLPTISGRANLLDVQRLQGQAVGAGSSPPEQGPPAGPQTVSDFQRSLGTRARLAASHS